MNFRETIMAAASGNGAYGGGTWTPLALGTSLLAWWSAERTDLITKDGSNRVSSWKDVVGGRDAVQATQAAQPIWSATGFNTRPAVTLDGADDYLAYEGMSGLPTGATPCEEWYAVDQQGLASSASVAYLGTSGGTTTTVRRGLVRAVVSGVNRLQAVDTSVTVTESTVDFSGRHVVRSVNDGALLNAEIDGTAGTPAAAVPAIGTTRVRFGASQATTPANFGKFAMADRVFTGILSAGQATQLRNFLSRGV